MVLKVLVENKVDAIFQPRQPEKYQERAASYIQRGQRSLIVVIAVYAAGFSLGSFIRSSGAILSLDR